MEKIITDIDVLSVPSEPLEFLTEQGAQKEEGTEIINKIKERVSKEIPDVGYFRNFSENFEKG